jgi:signal transduction histidine kinase
MLQEASQNGQSLNRELTFVSSQKGNLTLQVSASLVKDKLNTSLGFVIVSRDISQTKLLENSLRELYSRESEQRRELEEEAKNKSLFIDILAHELRTPLTPVLNSASMLDDMMGSNSSGSLGKLARNILVGVRVLENRLDELLDLARYSRGTFKINLQPCNLQEFFERIFAVYKSSLDRNEPRLIIDLPEFLPAVDMDASRLEQVIHNLLSNAEKYNSPDGKIFFKAAINDKTLRVEIKDEGCGIPENEIENIFKPYHRIQRDRPVSGLGLGLAVCKQIVEAHGGKIRIESKVGMGSVFSFAVPVTVKQ